MINEELKTFISKMRAVGKTDLEITAELKVAGWEERTVHRVLPVKSGFNKLKFWILLYGITILLFVGGIALGPTLNEKNVPLVNEIGVVFATFISVVLPIFTLLAIFSGTLNVILAKVFPDKNIPSISYSWLLVIASAISGIILVLLGVLTPVSPEAEMGNMLLLFLPVLGMFWLVFSLITGIVLSVKVVLRREADKRWPGWIILFVATAIVLIVLSVSLVLSLRSISTKLF